MTAETNWVGIRLSVRAPAKAPRTWGLTASVALSHGTEPLLASSGPAVPTSRRSSGRSGTSPACSSGRATHGPMRQLPASRLSTTDAQHPSARAVTESLPVAASSPTIAPRATPSTESCVAIATMLWRPVAAPRCSACIAVSDMNTASSPTSATSPLNSRSARTGASAARSAVITPAMTAARPVITPVDRAGARPRAKSPMRSLAR